MSLLLPDPCDPCCPDVFKQRARNILPQVQGKPGTKDVDLRNALLRFIGDFANWDNSANPIFLEAARGLVRAAHGEEPPLVVDSFRDGDFDFDVTGISAPVVVQPHAEVHTFEVLHDGLTP